MAEHMNGYTCEDVEDALLDAQRALASAEACADGMQGVARGFEQELRALRDALIHRQPTYAECRVCKRKTEWINAEMYHYRLGHAHDCPVLVADDRKPSPATGGGGS